jgi:hypothetical protein
MSNQLLVLCALAGFLGSGIGLDVAQAAAIPPVTGGNVTLTIFAGGVDVSDTWLPEPGQVVTLVANNAGTNPVLTLVPSTSTSATRTSAYPGQCTNFPANVATPDTTDDFRLSGNQLTPTDCGGRAVIQVNGTSTFILPRDSDNDGIPDIWEKRYCPTTSPNCLTNNPAIDPRTNPNPNDIDTGPGTLQGDGIANIDEYRGFIIRGQHVRTNPQLKDLFVQLFHPQCQTAGTSSLLGGGAVTYPADGTSIFAAMQTLISAEQIHTMDHIPDATNSRPNDEWVDNLQRYYIDFANNNRDVFEYRTADGNITDRQINRHAVHKLIDGVTGKDIQKGLRITECLDLQANCPVTNSTCLVGSAGWGSANGPDNALIYTRRIANYVDKLIADGQGKPLRYATFVNGKSTTPVATNRDTLISKVLQFYVAMEFGHAVRLTTTTTSTGYHSAAGTGDNMDQACITKIDSRSNTNTFYIPSTYSSTDQANFRPKN